MGNALKKFLGFILIVIAISNILGVFGQFYGLPFGEIYLYILTILIGGFIFSISKRTVDVSQYRTEVERWWGMSFLAILLIIISLLPVLDYFGIPATIFFEFYFSFDFIFNMIVIVIGCLILLMTVPFLTKKRRFETNSMRLGT